MSQFRALVFSRMHDSGIREINIVAVQGRMVPSVTHRAITLPAAQGLNQLFLEVTFTEFGPGRFGPIERDVALFLLNKEDLLGDSLWRERLRESSRHSATGLLSVVESSLDLASVDARGRSDDSLPVRGATRSAYLSVLRNDIEGASASRVAIDLLDSGWVMQKWRYPASGDQAALLTFIEQVTEAGVSLALELDRRWALGEAESRLAALADHELLWIEEPLRPGVPYSLLSGAERLPRLSAGEHAYALNEFAGDLGCAPVAVWQPEVRYCGGLDSLQEISAVGRSLGKEIVPHGGSTKFLLALPDACSPSLVEYNPYAESFRDAFMDLRVVGESGQVRLAFDGQGELGTLRAGLTRDRVTVL